MTDQADIVAIIRMLKYVRKEVKRLGLNEAEWFLDLLILSVTRAVDTGFKETTISREHGVRSGKAN